jgi:hypothetical protein
MADSSPRSAPADRPGRGIVAAGIVAALFLLAAIAAIHSGCSLERARDDQDTYHLPAIRNFQRQWPHLDFSDYPSATTPAYHVIMAAVGRSLGAATPGLRILGALFTGGLLATLAMAAARRGGMAAGIALGLPMVCSIYVFSSGAWLLPDNAGWWGVLGVLLIALRTRVDAWTFAGGGLLLLFLVLTRQIHLWAAAPLCAAAWLGTGTSAGAMAAHASAGRARRMLAMLVAILPSLAVLGWLFHLWHGTVPPQQQSLVGGGNAAAPAAALAVAGMFGVFYAGFLPSGALSKPGGPRRWAVAGAVLGAFAAAVPLTTYDFPAGRYSGIWNLVLHVPTILNRSPLIITLAGLGGATVALWLAALPRRDRVICAVAVGAFLVAQLAAHNAFQRYYEPFILIIAAVTVVRFPPPRARWAPLGPLLLAVLLGGLTVWTMVGK